MSQSKRVRQDWRVTEWARSFLKWCQIHPIPGTLTVLVGVMIALTTLAQGMAWTAEKLWPPLPKILGTEEIIGVGGNFSILIENPTDVSMVVTEAVLRAEPPPTGTNASYNELRIPAVTYDVPFNCLPGTNRVKLNPPFKVSAKEVGAVVFRSTLPMHPCRLYVSMTTSQGQTREQEGVSLASWRKKLPK